jgi:YaiO family outer membrane protein
MLVSKPAWVLSCVACIGLCAGLAPAAWAQQESADPAAQPPATQPGPKKVIQIGELGGGYAWYSEPFGTGEGLFARYTRMRLDKYTLRVEGNYGSRFDQTGRAIGVSYARILRSKTILSANVATGSGLLAPEYRIELSASHPFLRRRNMLLTFRLKAEQSKVENSTRGFSVGMVYYFPRYWIVETNARYDRGQPGNTDSYGIGAAVTYAIYKKLYIVGGFDYGDTNYVIVGDQEVLSNLLGSSYNIGVVRWVKPDWGFNVRLEFGSNNVYDGRGVQVSFFKEW